MSTSACLPLSHIGPEPQTEVMLPLITACPIEGGTGTNFCPILRPDFWVHVRLRFGVLGLRVSGCRWRVYFQELQFPGLRGEGFGISEVFV